MDLAALACLRFLIACATPVIVPPAVTAATWIVSDLESGEVLAAKDPHARERPASLIKVLLSIVVIRELRDAPASARERTFQFGQRGGEHTR